MDKVKAQAIADKHFPDGATFTGEVDGRFIFIQSADHNGHEVIGHGPLIVYSEGRAEQLSTSPIMWPDWYADWVDSLDG